MTYYRTHPTPLGLVTMTSGGTALTRLLVGDVAIENANWQSNDSLPIFAETCRQLNEYFLGTRTTFDLPLAPEGTEFQQRVWDKLQGVSYGATASYGEIAAQLGNPNASRAVGLANGRNPLWIVVPCHRIVGASGALTGYAGGLHRKRALLDFEAAIFSGEKGACASCKLEPDQATLFAS